MGWAKLPSPGTEHGPCRGPCEHKDCAETRGMADALCVYCGETIGFDAPFYHVRASGKKPEGYAHARCTWETIQATFPRPPGLARKVKP